MLWFSTLVVFMVETVTIMWSTPPPPPNSTYIQKFVWSKCRKLAFASLEFSQIQDVNHFTYFPSKIVMLLTFALFYARKTIIFGRKSFCKNDLVINHDVAWLSFISFNKLHVTLCGFKLVTNTDSWSITEGLFIWKTQHSGVVVSPIIVEVFFKNWCYGYDCRICCLNPHY